MVEATDKTVTRDTPVVV